MKRDFPMYEGDGFIRNPAAREISLLEDVGKTAFAGPFVDFSEIEKQASRARSQARRGAFARLFDRLEANVHRARYRELEKYLGQSTDRADLERRLRELGAAQRGVLAHG